MRITIEAGDRRRRREENQIKYSRYKYVDIENAGAVDVIGVFFLDQRGGKTGVDENTPDRNKNHQKCDVAEIRRRQQPGKNDRKEEIQSPAADIAQPLPEDAGEDFVFQIVLHGNSGCHISQYR